MKIKPGPTTYLGMYPSSCLWELNKTLVRLTKTILKVAITTFYRTTNVIRGMLGKLSNLKGGKVWEISQEGVCV